MAFELYNIVKDTTGEIERQIGADITNDATAVSSNTPSGYSAYLGDLADTPEKFYYVGATKTAKPVFTTSGSWDTTSITANGTSTATFSSLPNPTEVVVIVPFVQGVSQPGLITVTSGSFALTTTVPGNYVVTFATFPYQPLTTTITAT